MPDSIIIKVDPSQIQLMPGAQGTLNVTVRNRTEEVENYLLSLEGAQPGWGEVAPDQLSAFPMQDVQASVTIHPPQDARGAVYHLTLRARSQTRSGVEGLAPFDVDVPLPAAAQPETQAPPPVTETAPVTPPPPQAASQIEVVAEPAKEPKLPPPGAQWKLYLHNAGTVLDTFAFSIAGIKPGWVRIDPPQVTLKPDEANSAVLSVQPPPDTAAGTYPFTLRTFSHLNLRQRTEIPLKIEVKATAGFQLSTDPKDAEAQGQRDFKVVLASSANSNTDLTVDLSAADQDNACQYTFDPAQVFVPAKQTVTSTLHARPRAPLGPNERKTYTIKVTATPRDGAAPAQVAEARLTQVAAVPLRLVLRPQQATGDLDADYTLLVVNPSGVDASLVFSGEDPELGCEYAFTPARVTLAPGSESQVKVKVKARANYEGEGQKEYPFTLSATRAGELTPVAAAQGKFVQRQTKPISVALIPPQLSSAGAAHYTLKVLNPLARQVQIFLDAHDEADALAFTFSTNEIDLAPGSEGVATVNVRPKDRLSAGEQRRVHKFEVSATVEGGAAPPAAKGTFAQIRGFDWDNVTGGGAKLLIWAVRWLIALLILWFMVTVVFAGIDALPTRNARLAQTLYSIVSPDLVRIMINISPFGGIARWIVDVILQIVDAVIVR